MYKVIIVVGVVLSLTNSASAADRPRGWRCAIVQKAVAAYGEVAAIQWAKNHGWSDSKIIEAQKCLGDRSN